MKVRLIHDGEYSWDIEFCDMPDEGDPDCEGTCEKPTLDEPGHIRVRGCVPRFRLRQILMHEMFHAGEYAEGVELDHKALDSMARYLTRLFDHNPDLVAFFTPKKKRPKKAG